MEIFDLEETSTFISDAKSRVEYMHLVNNMVKVFKTSASTLWNGGDFLPIHELSAKCIARINDVLQDELLHCTIEFCDAVDKARYHGDCQVKERECDS